MFIEANDSLPQLVSPQTIGEGSQLLLHFRPRVHIGEELPERQPVRNTGLVYDSWQLKGNKLKSLSSPNSPQRFHVWQLPAKLGKLLHGFQVSSFNVAGHTHSVLEREALHTRQWLQAELLSAVQPELHGDVRRHKHCDSCIVGKTQGRGSLVYCVIVVRTK